MRKLSLKLEGIKQMLTKEEMKKIVGGDYGGGCCCTHNGNSDWECGMSKSEAESQAAAQHINWCCDSCSSVGAPAPCEA